MNRLLLLSFIFLSQSAFSQYYISKTKAEVNKELNVYAEKHQRLKPGVVVSDTAIILTITESADQEIKFIYRFDKRGKCNLEQLNTTCEDCYTRYLTTALAQKEIGFKKINGNQYISNFATKMMIEITGDKNIFSYLIIQTDWSKEMYEILLANNK